MKGPVLVTSCVFATLICVGVHASFAADGSSAGQARDTTANRAPVAKTDHDPSTDRQDKADKRLLPTGNAGIDQLLRLWGVFGEKIHASCDDLHVGALHCLAEQGTLETLARFNRPAILVLRHDGKKQRVLISRLSKTHATIAGADSARRLPRERLRQLWTGRFEMIWRTDTGAVLLYPGMRGSAVAWLRSRLALASGSKPDAGPKAVSRYFGSSLEARVRHFQLMHGLRPDGLVGPRTQIVLNGIKPGAGVPTLTKSSEE